MKVDRKIYKGIEYVTLSELPQVQQEHLVKTLPSEFFIKILIDGSIVSRCIQYRDYSMWFDQVFSSRSGVQVLAKQKSEITVEPKLAMDQA